MKNLWISLLVLLPVLVACKKQTTTPTPEPTIQYQPEASVKTALSKGINLSNWFNDYSDPNQFGTRFTETDFTRIKSLGFTHIRLPIGSTILYQENNPTQLKAQNLTFVKNAIKKITDAGLAVIIDPLHECCDEFVEKKLATDATYVTKVASYWKAVATEFKSYSSDKVFFEVFNEPHVATSKSVPGLSTTWWSPVQEKLLKAIREVDTDHYIIVGGESWNSIDGLKALTAYKITRLIYNFHFYSPFTFTHQGADWTGEPQKSLRNVPYPSTPENIKPLIDQATNTDVKNTLTWYGDARYNAAKLESEIITAVNWAKKYDVYLTCNEFGAYKPVAPRQSRLDCIKDVRTILEQYQIGWSMWEYDEGFGIQEYTNNDRSKPVIDTEVTKALGLSQ